MIAKNKIKQSSRIIGLFIILVIIFLNGLGTFLGIQQLITLGMLPLLAFISFNIDIKSYKLKKTELLLLIAIFLSSIISVFYLVDYDAFLRNLSLFFGAIIAAYIPMAINKTGKYEDYFQIGFILSILVLFLIMYSRGNIDFSTFATKVDYRNRFLLNANSYSYYSVFANFSLFYLFIKYRNKILAYLLFLMPLLFIIIAFTTQSRQGLALIILINIAFWLFVNKTRSKNKTTKASKAIIALIAISLFSIQFVKIYQNSRVQNRVSQVTQRTDSRTVLIYVGLLTFAENPVLGVGLGQFPFYNDYHLFSHNSFVEVMAEQGIIGIFLLLLMYGIPIKKSIHMFKSNRDSEVARCNLLFFVVFLVYSNFYVFYKFPFSMMYFFLVIAIQNNMINQNNKIKDVANIS